ncbi:MAG: regulatory protein RecX [Candidatus Saccharibacteria bacterium]|nr:regulatory protein RecX [Candidatus Saccharibacteria bacterium]
MKITAIKQQVRRTDRYSIFVDDKYSFALSELGLINSRLAVGQEYSETELANLLGDAEFDKAYGRVLDLIARRKRSEWEIRDYLKRKDYQPPLIEQVLNRLRQAGFVNDADFARAWVNNRRLLKATSKRRLQQELRQKRLSDEVIAQALEEDQTDERDVLKELVAKKRQQTRYQDDLKLMQYLSRQGYNYADIKSAMHSEN